MKYIRRIDVSNFEISIFPTIHVRIQGMRTPVKTVAAGNLENM